MIGFDSVNKLVIGKPARKYGLTGKTNTYHFKPDLGSNQDESVYGARIDRAGRQQQGRVKPYWVRGSATTDTVTFTPLEAAEKFLSLLLPKSKNPLQKLIVGEPTLSARWRDNYRKNIRTILANLGYDAPIFFPEPFAVYHYFRKIENAISDSTAAQTILVIDFGGGTFDCCVIRTNKTGELGKGGAHSKPLGENSVEVAGEALDIRLLNLVHAKAKASGVLFKDDPIIRAKQSAQCLWTIEDAKIFLSTKISENNLVGSTELSKLTRKIRIPAGCFHANEEINTELTGEEFKECIISLWDNEWGKTILRCHRDAEEKLDSKIEKYDYVLIAGGSAQLPFLEGLVRHTLPIQTETSKILTGGQAGASVAKGIAVECMEQANRHPSLVRHQLVNCLLSNMYIRVGKSKAEKLKPKIRLSNAVNNNAQGLVYKSPGIMEERTIKCTLELRQPPKGAFHYWFHSSETGTEDPINPITSVRISGSRSVDRKVAMELFIEEDGTVFPKFTFTHHGRTPEEKNGQPFSLGTKLQEGSVFLGVDFGTCNSYLASYFVPFHVVDQTAYPNYEIGNEIRTRLLKLNERCVSLNESQVLTTKTLLVNARELKLDFIFHSNKIEGNRLSKGQTEQTLSSTNKVKSKDQLEAINLREGFTPFPQTV